MVARDGVAGVGRHRKGVDSSRLCNGDGGVARCVVYHDNLRLTIDDPGQKLP
jgi:hypothetical protein